MVVTLGRIDSRFMGKFCYTNIRMAYVLCMQNKTKWQIMSLIFNLQSRDLFGALCVGMTKGVAENSLTTQGEVGTPLMTGFGQSLQ